MSNIILYKLERVKSREKGHQKGAAIIKTRIKKCVERSFKVVSWEPRGKMTKVAKVRIKDLLTDLMWCLKEGEMSKITEVLEAL